MYRRIIRTSVHTACLKGCQTASHDYKECFSTKCLFSVDRWSLYRGVLPSLRWHKDLTTVVSVDRWSLYRGVLPSLRWHIGLTTVVSVDRWSL